MQLVTKLNNVWTKLVLWFYRKLDDRLWKERLNTALKDLNKDDLALFGSVLHNQMQHQRVSQGAYISNTTFGSRAAQIKFDNMLFKVVCRTLHHLKELRSIIGIQPMAGPVGLVYQMLYTPVEEDAQRADGSKHLRLEVVKLAITASTRRLNAGWSLEVGQDLAAQHGVDIQDELVQVLAHEIAHEIAAEVFTNLKQLALWSGRVQTVQSMSFDHSMEYVSDQGAVMGIKLNTLANQIAQASRRGPGNFIVGNALAVALMHTLGSAFVPVPKGSPAGVLLTHVGTLNGSIKVYYSSVITSDELIVGYMGQNQVDTGYIYSPYVPLLCYGPVINPVTFQPIMSLMTRSGTNWCGKDEKTLGETSGAYYALLQIGTPITPEEPVDQPKTTE
jgi:Major capsid protein Gp23